MTPSAFDCAALTAFLDGEQAAIRERLRRLLSSPEFAVPSERGLETSREAYRAQVLAWCRRLAAEGIGALGLPRGQGGGGDPAAFLAAFETIAHHDLSLLVKFGVQFGLFAGSLHRLGTERHHAAYLPAAGALDLPGCFAMTETGHGSNVADLETSALYAPGPPGDGAFVIHTPHTEARKDYIGGAARDARLAVVFAQLETLGTRQGVHAFAVPIRDAAGHVLPGVRVEDCGPKLGLNGVDNGRIAFDHVRVPREALLDRFAAVAADGTYTSPIASPSRRFFTMLGTLVGGRVSVALAAVSAAKSALCIAVRYAGRRRQFGAPGEPETLLLDYPAHQRRLLPRLATTYALHFAVRDLAARYVRAQAEDPLKDGDSREIEGLAAGLKAVATWHATDTLQACREACGGQGYLAVNRFAALKADSDVFTTFEGDNTVLLQLVAKGLLSDYRKQFGDMNFVDLMRYVAARAGTTVRDLNPIVTRMTDPDHLRDPDFHLAALGWREEHLLATVARRLKKRLDTGMEPAQAMLECQTHLLATARAHVDRIVVERATEAITAAAGLDAVLRPLLALHALSRLEADAGWLLEHGVLEAAKARAIRKEVDALCRELRPAARGLVDAFAIPDELLAAPIAT